MRTIETTVYLFDELSENAKENAREWFRNSIDFTPDLDYYIETAALFGLDIDQIYYRGFYSQGDGASFEGRYEYKPSALRVVKTERPNWTELHSVVERLQHAQARHFFKLRAKITHRGHYYHANCMNFEVSHADDEYRDVTSGEEELSEIFRDYARMIYNGLEKAFDYENGDEYVDDEIRANEYEFTKTGKII